MEINQMVDLISILRLLRMGTRRIQAVLLSQLEEVLGKDSEEYLKVRKSVLDETSRFSRSVARAIFGDIEIP